MEILKQFKVSLCLKSLCRVKTGRNLAIIIESAAMNYRAETMGYDATETFDRNLNQLIKQNSERDSKNNKGAAN